MKNLKLILTVIIAFTYCANAQVVSSSSPTGGPAENNPYAKYFQRWTPMMQELFQKVKNANDYTTEFVGAEIGTAYENENFQKGNVLYNDEVLGTVYYRLNAFNDEIEIKKTNLPEEKQLALLKTKEIKIAAPNKELLFLSFSDQKDVKNTGYLYLISKGERYTFFKRIVKKYTEAKPAANSMVNPIPSRFTDYIEYYYKAKDKGMIQEFPIHKNKLGKLFSNDKASEISKYFKKNRPDEENETEVLNLFRYIDSLD